MIANTPNPPYYAVIFTSIRTEIEDDYLLMAIKMVEMAQVQEGYLGHESAREGLGITVSYWKSLDAIKQWKMNVDHLFAQKFGKSKWYAAYKTRICLVERDYGFDKFP